MMSMWQTCRAITGLTNINHSPCHSRPLYTDAIKPCYYVIYIVYVCKSMTLMHYSCNMQFNSLEI
jgi:hypothetical protein